MKKTIAVIFGGRSAEHDVSTITAHTPIISALQATNQYDVIPVYITKQGAWYSDPAMNDIAFFKNPNYEADLAKTKKLQLGFDNGLQLIWPGGGGMLGGKATSVNIDVVFPSMHGTYGEDGSLMGILRMAGVPFVGCDLAASAVAMDKVLTKQVAGAVGVPIVPYVWFMAAEWNDAAQKAELTQQINALKWPVFVKPVHLGSSIGITKASTPQELENAVEVALHYDDKVLVEESIENLIEVTLPVMGNNELTLASIERPLNKTEFFNFEDKYMGSGGKKGSGGLANQYSELPAKIGDELKAAVEKAARETYKAVGCTGIARIDFLIDSETNQVYMNEINTLPGSLYHHNWKTAGVSSMELVTRLITLAEERFAQQQSKTYSFQSDILKGVGGAKS